MDCCEKCCYNIGGHCTYDKPCAEAAAERLGLNDEFYEWINTKLKGE